ncbi:hypothetical protein SFRURICE_002459 [Spodoptera frugiperda]|nr:hypothetical protein SFRURICE_002459 [Spodoptera frugiperda]
MPLKEGSKYTPCPAVVPGKGSWVRFPGRLSITGLFSVFQKFSVWKCARYIAIGTPPITWE